MAVIGGLFLQQKKSTLEEKEGSRGWPNRVLALGTHCSRLTPVLSHQAGESNSREQAQVEAVGQLSIDGRLHGF